MFFSYDKIFTILFVITKVLGNKKNEKNKENEIPIRKRLKKNRKNKRNKTVVIIIKKEMKTESPTHNRGQNRVFLLIKKKNKIKHVFWQV
jgi:ribose 1,5-bisphosphokinase PhnN